MLFILLRMLLSIKLFWYKERLVSLFTKNLLKMENLCICQQPGNSFLARHERNLLKEGGGGGGWGGVERMDRAMVGGGRGLAQVGDNVQRREFKIVRTMLTVQSAPLLD